MAQINLHNHLDRAISEIRSCLERALIFLLSLKLQDFLLLKSRVGHIILLFTNHKSYVLSAILLVFHVAAQSAPMIPPDTPTFLSPISPIDMTIADQIAKEMEENVKRLKQLTDDSPRGLLDITSSRRFNQPIADQEKIKKMQSKLMQGLGLDDSSGTQNQQNSRILGITNQDMDHTVDSEIVLTAVEQEEREAEIASRIAVNKEKATILGKKKEPEWTITGKQIAEVLEIERQRRAEDRKGDEGVVISSIDLKLHENIVADLRREIAVLKEKLTLLGNNTIGSTEVIDGSAINNNRVKQSVEDSEIIGKNDQAVGREVADSLPDTNIADYGFAEDEAINKLDEVISRYDNSDVIFFDEEIVEDSATIDAIKIEDRNEPMSQTSQGALSDTKQSIEEMELGVVEEDSSKNLGLEGNNLAINGSRTRLHNIANQLDQVRANQIVVRQVMQVPYNIIQHRLVSFSNAVAVSAGNEVESRNTGVWGSNSYKLSKQRGSDDIVGYRGSGAAVIIGCDKEISDSSIVGIAYGKSGVSVRFRDMIGKSVIKSNILSIYGHHDLTSKIFMQLTGSYQSSSVRNYSNGGLGRYRMQGIGIAGNIGSQGVIVQGIEIIPNIGIRYHWLTGGQDLEIDELGSRIKTLKKGAGIVSGNIGVYVMLPQVMIDSGISIRPVMHGSIERDLSRGQHKQIVMVAGEELLLANNARRVSSGNVSTNIGCALVIKKDRVGIGIDYNHYVRQKYREHEAVIKVLLHL